MSIRQETVKYLKLEELDRLRNKRIAIYGAGLYGALLHFLFVMRGMEDNIVCFVVSDRDGNPEQLFGKPILLLDDLLPDCDDIVFLVAIKKADAIIERLRGLNIFNFLLLTEMMVEDIKQEIFNRYSKFPIQKNKIFFYCYEGEGYRCNCKYIAEKFLEKDYYVEMVWALAEGVSDAELPSKIKVVRTFTEEYYKELYTSSVIVINSGKDPSVYKREGQFCINTWHGYGPFKKTQGALSWVDADKVKAQNSYYDLFLTASTFYSSVYRSSFYYEGEIIEIGAPRNDILFTENGIKEKIYRYFQIPSEKKIVLFAPTYRNDRIDSFNQYYLDVEGVLAAIQERFCSEYIWMYRFHHLLYQIKEREGFYQDGIDVTLYPDIQELLAAADIVITDYSSLMWDFSLQRRPVFLFQPDEQKYIGDHGFYAPISEWPYPHAHTQKELIDVIRNFDENTYIRDVDLFLKKYGSCDDGNASERLVTRIMETITVKGE